MSSELLAPEPLEEVAARLARSFRRHGGFVFELVLVATPLEGRMLWEALTSAVEASEHAAPRGGDELARTLRPGADRRLRYVDLSAQSLSAPDWQDALSILNQRRNGIVQELDDQYLVWVLDQRDEAAFASAAPDLWSIRSGTHYATAFDVPTAAAIRAGTSMIAVAARPSPGSAEARFRQALGLVQTMESRDRRALPGDSRYETALHVRKLFSELVAEDPHERPWVEEALRHEARVARMLAERRLLGAADQVLTYARARAESLGVAPALRGELAREHLKILEAGDWSDRARQAKCDAELLDAVPPASSKTG